MRIQRPLLLLVIGIALVAAFFDGYAYIFRLATHRSLTSPLDQRPNVSIGFLGLSRDIYLRKGLDLQGGTRLELQVTEVRSGKTLAEARDISVAILERRVNGIGVSESVVRPVGANRIDVELPGVGLEQAKEVLGKTAYLTIWKWVPGNPDEELQQKLNLHPPGSERPYHQDFKPEYTGIDGSMITQAVRSVDQTSGMPDVLISFDARGANLFRDLTRDRVTRSGAERNIAIFLDKDLIQDANVISEIPNGQGIITGGFTLETAQQLALQLSSGALPGKIEVIQSSEVGGTLGANTVRLSLLAGGFGLAIVVLFMILYYRLPGVVASVALLIYAGVVLGIFKLVGVTLTLAGLAGFILSVGMAVDANVLIFERVKEELRSGRTLGAAMEAGVARAWPAIRDSNTSTLITCFVLYFFGAPLIKGFAVTLAIGVGVSMFSAIVTTQQLLQVIAGIRPARRLALYGVEAPLKAA